MKKYVKTYKSFLNEDRTSGNPLVSIPEIKPDDRIIMSGGRRIVPRNTNQKTVGYDENGIGFKPMGLWYALGTEWIDWVRSNMPDWEQEYLHKLTINKSKILDLDKYGWSKFEKKYGATNKYYLKNSNVVTDIAWDYVQADGWYGIEIKNPWGDIGSWSRTWDISSGCIWDKRAIKSIKLIN
jgi:hypothetical protein